MWDPDYELQEGDEVMDPPAGSADSKDGYVWEDVEFGYNETISISMNWGWENVSDVYYTARVYYSPVNYGEYTSPAYERVYSPAWSVTLGGNVCYYNQFQYMIYNIAETES